MMVVPASLMDISGAGNSLQLDSGHVRLKPRHEEDNDALCLGYLNFDQIGPVLDANIDSTLRSKDYTRDAWAQSAFSSFDKTNKRFADGQACLRFSLDNAQNRLEHARVGDEFTIEFSAMFENVNGNGDLVAQLINVNGLLRWAVVFNKSRIYLWVYETAMLFANQVLDLTGLMANDTWYDLRISYKTLAVGGSRLRQECRDAAGNLLGQVEADYPVEMAAEGSENESPPLNIGGRYSDIPGFNLLPTGAMVGARIDNVRLFNKQMPLSFAGFGDTQPLIYSTASDPAVAIFESGMDFYYWDFSTFDVSDETVCATTIGAGAATDYGWIFSYSLDEGGSWSDYMTVADLRLTPTVEAQNLYVRMRAISDGLSAYYPLAWMGIDRPLTIVEITPGEAADLVVEMAEYMASRLTTLTAGENCFAWHEPDQISEPSAVFIGTGGPPERDDRAWEDQTVQCLVLAPTGNKKAGFNLAQAIYDELHGSSNWALPHFGIAWSRGIQRPYAVGRDKKNREAWSMNFLMSIRRADVV